jgi:hypothetical protein
MGCCYTSPMNKMDSPIQEELDAIEVHPGDIILDHFTGYIGVLISRERRIDMFIDDIYFWEVKWTKNFHKRNGNKIDISGVLEEETLKLSILIGAIELYSVKDKE